MPTPREGDWNSTEGESIARALIPQSTSHSAASGVSSGARSKKSGRPPPSINITCFN